MPGKPTPKVITTGGATRWAGAASRELAHNFRIIRADRLGSFGALVIAFAALVATNVGLVLVDRAGTASLFGAFCQANPALWWLLGMT